MDLTGAYWASLMAQMVKNLPSNAGDQGLIPGWKRSSGEGNAAHSSILAGEVYGQRSLMGYSHGVAKSRTQIFRNQRIREVATEGRGVGSSQGSPSAEGTAPSV